LVEKAEKVSKLFQPETERLYRNTKYCRAHPLSQWAKIIQKRFEVGLSIKDKPLVLYPKEGVAI
jgi:hypothetical protein